MFNGLSAMTGNRYYREMQGGNRLPYNGELRCKATGAVAGCYNGSDIMSFYDTALDGAKQRPHIGRVPRISV
jgi:hypothetical protein